MFFFKIIIEGYICMWNERIFLTKHYTLNHAPCIEINIPIWKKNCLVIREIVGTACIYSFEIHSIETQLRRNFFFTVCLVCWEWGRLDSPVCVQAFCLCWLISLLWLQWPPSPFSSQNTISPNYQPQIR